jgi:hypothetical protein
MSSLTEAASFDSNVHKQSRTNLERQTSYKQITQDSAYDLDRMLSPLIQLKKPSQHTETDNHASLQQTMCPA